MKLTFLGATHEVTGSCTLIEINGSYGIVDCGMEQGQDLFENQSLPVEAFPCSTNRATPAPFTPPQPPCIFAR